VATLKRATEEKTRAQKDGNLELLATSITTFTLARQQLVDASKVQTQKPVTEALVKKAESVGKTIHKLEIQYRREEKNKANAAVEPEPSAGNERATRPVELLFNLMKGSSGFGLKLDTHAQIRELVPGGVAEQALVPCPSQVIRVGGQEIKSKTEMFAIIRQYNHGDTVEFVIGGVDSVSVPPELRSAVISQEAEAQPGGMSSDAAARAERAAAAEREAAAIEVERMQALRTEAEKKQLAVAAKQLQQAQALRDTEAQERKAAADRQAAAIEASQAELPAPPSTLSPTEATELAVVTLKRANEEKNIAKQEGNLAMTEAAIGSFMLAKQQLLDASKLQSQRPVAAALEKKADAVQATVEKLQVQHRKLEKKQVTHVLAAQDPEENVAIARTSDWVRQSSTEVNLQPPPEEHATSGSGEVMFQLQKGSSGFGMRMGANAEIEGLIPGGVAELASVPCPSQILRVGGKEVTTKREAFAVIRHYNHGDTVEFVIGGTHTASVPNVGVATGDPPNQAQSDKGPRVGAAVPTPQDPPPPAADADSMPPPGM
jgi:hypothetical protein